MSVEMNEGQTLAFKLSQRILLECAVFCDEECVKDKQIDEHRVCMTALQTALIAMIGNHPNGDVVRLKLAESLVDGTAKKYIDGFRDQLNNRGKHEH